MVRRTSNRTGPGVGAPESCHNFLGFAELRGCPPPMTGAILRVVDEDDIGGLPDKGDRLDDRGGDKIPLDEYDLKQQQQQRQKSTTSVRRHH